jgi:hypothetical protein
MRWQCHNIFVFHPENAGFMQAANRQSTCSPRAGFKSAIISFAKALAARFSWMGCRHPLPRALHPVGSCRCARHWGRLCDLVWSFHGVGRVPGRDDRQSIRLQPPSRDRSSPDARRFRGSFLRLCRNAIQPLELQPGVVDDHVDLPCYSGGKTDRGVAGGPDAQLSRPRRPLRGDRLIPDWRVFFYSRVTGKRAEDSTGNSGGLLVASSMISITLNPILYRLARPTAKLIGQNQLLRWLLDPVASTRGAEARYEEKGLTPRQRAIVIGYGPIGRLVVRLLQENEIEPTIVELNPKTVQLLCAQGIRAIYGDASHIETLRVAGLEKTRNLILTASELSGAVELIRAARDANPKVHIVARTVRLETKKSLLDAGADRVFSAEGEMALSITECLLQSLGATQEQLEANRDSIRKTISVLSFG